MCDLEVAPSRKEPTMSNRSLIARSLAMDSFHLLVLQVVRHLVL